MTLIIINMLLKFKETLSKMTQSGPMGIFKGKKGLRDCTKLFFFQQFLHYMSSWNESLHLLVSPTVHPFQFFCQPFPLFIPCSNTCLNHLIKNLTKTETINLNSCDCVTNIVLLLEVVLLIHRWRRNG